MEAWIAQLRDEGSVTPGSDARPSGGTAIDQPPDDGGAKWEIAVPLRLQKGLPPARGGFRPGTAGLALIGDQLRIPIVWCEIAPCISHHTNPAALGEADIRARALSAGWRLDRLGRLTCPECQQSSPCFWPAHPVALWDKEAAATMVALMAACDRSNGASHNAQVARGLGSAGAPVTSAAEPVDRRASPQVTVALRPTFRA
jgi:hypothetical protein